MSKQESVTNAVDKAMDIEQVVTDAIQYAKKKGADHVEISPGDRIANRYRLQHSYYFLGNAKSDALNKGRHVQQNIDPKELALFD